MKWLVYNIYEALEHEMNSFSDAVCYSDRQWVSCVALQPVVMEVRRMKERQKLARQQERYHRQMQLRMERELRSRQITQVASVQLITFILCVILVLSVSVLTWNYQ